MFLYRPFKVVARHRKVYPVEHWWVFLNIKLEKVLRALRMKLIRHMLQVAAYWLFVVLMLATFTANLAAFLTVERMQTPVQSLDQLARQSRINYTVVEGSDTHKYFINMKFAEDTLYRMWKELTLNSTSDQSQYRVWDYPIKVIKIFDIFLLWSLKITLIVNRVIFAKSIRESCLPFLCFWLYIFTYIYSILHRNNTDIYCWP